MPPTSLPRTLPAVVGTTGVKRSGCALADPTPESSAAPAAPAAVTPAKVSRRVKPSAIAHPRLLIGVED